MPTPARRITRLETALLRRSVGAATAGRDRCRHCQRTPLVGERVHFYDADSGTELVCDLCRPVRTDAPQRTELMHSPEHDRAVRVLRAAA
ncbi:MAG: hypothetical protein H0U80_02965 [Solirubrobacterales bacterium]|nr:hypothetical protein [Solirubrobacterales bacterium]